MRRCRRVCHVPFVVLAVALVRLSRGGTHAAAHGRFLVAVVEVILICAGGVANRKEQRSSGARSFQNLDLANNAIYNVVEFNAPFGARGCISVRGEVNREDGSTLGVCFIESSVTLKGAPKVLGQEPPTITVPLPRPRGFVTTTYLDGDWRISRGSRSNVFLTVRTPRESRREGGEGGGKDEGPYT